MMQSEKAKGVQFEIHLRADLNIDIPLQKLKNDLLINGQEWSLTLKFLDTAVRQMHIEFGSSLLSVKQITE